jgi:hypothetical protein
VLKGSPAEDAEDTGEDEDEETAGEGRLDEFWKHGERRE